MWHKKEDNYTPEELVERIKRYKPYFQDKGGVTFSGGEPLLHSKFIIETAKLLKEEDIHITLDTSGVGLGDYEELKLVVELMGKYANLILINQENKIIDAFGENEFNKALGSGSDKIIATIMYYPQINEFRGNREVQIVLSDVVLPTTS